MQSIMIFFDLVKTIVTTPWLALAMLVFPVKIFFLPDTVLIDVCALIFMIVCAAGEMVTMHRSTEDMESQY